MTRYMILEITTDFLPWSILTKSLRLTLGLEVPGTYLANVPSTQVQIYPNDTTHSYHTKKYYKCAMRHILVPSQG